MKRKQLRWLNLFLYESVVAVLLISLFTVQGFYVALRLVACAQSGQEVSLASLNLTIPPPKFVSTFIRQEESNTVCVITSLQSAAITGLYLYSADTH